jgi:hypothetical protein
LAKIANLLPKLRQVGVASIVVKQRLPGSLTLETPDPLMSQFDCHALQF